jgi:lipopolysaccharide/colanic/teichoic acid biosynthesis glycosyltransferase
LIRPALRQMLACFKPMVHIDVLARAVHSTLQEQGSTERLVTDDASQNVVYRAAKRTLDLGFALFVLVALWWLLLAVWALVRLTSPGPGIFAQERLGQHQRPFTCYKFRTMQAGTKQAGTHEISQASVTKIGGFLRGSKIDELPQIWNIFKGELSLVGPRPGLPVQHELTAARDAQGVYAVRPGITGLGQVQGVDMSDPDRLSRLDGLYVKTRTLVLDLKIILATAGGKGLGDRTKG